MKRHFAAYKLSDRNVSLASNEEIVGRVNSMWDDVTLCGMMLCLLKRSGNFFVMDLYLALR